MKKDYTLTFTMADGTTRTVNFSLPVAAANASEISCTGWIWSGYETTSLDFTIVRSSSSPKYSSDTYTVNFTKPVGNLEFSISGITIPGNAWHYNLSEDKKSATVYYRSDTPMRDSEGILILKGTVTIKAQQMLTNVEDCLNWLKNN